MLGCRRSLAWGLVLSAGALAACAGPQLGQPSSTEQGVLAIRVSLKGRELPNWITHHADEVFWAQVNPWGDLDLDHPLRSTVAKNGDCYVLDVPPGRYAPFAAAYSSLRLRFLARIDNDVRKELAVDLAPGGFAYAGDVSLRTEWDGPWIMLAHAGLHVLGALPPFKRPSVDIIAGAAKIEKDPAHEAALLRRARAALAPTLWSALAQERLDELGDPASPIVKGFIRKRVVPSVQLDRFSYIDTLKWGSARKIPGGLEWREPKGRARVIVGFVDEAAGGKPRAKALEELKLAGDTADDHVLYDVSVDSRPGETARYTSVSYPEQKLVGSDPSVYTTQATIVPAKGGYYVLVYRARKDAFDKFLPAYSFFLRHLRLRPKKKEGGPA